MIHSDYCTQSTAVSGQAGSSVSLSGLDISEMSNSSVSANRDALVFQHLPMVRFVAKHVYERMPKYVDLDDLISAGLVGLIDAAAKFDCNKQVQFKSYAQFRVRGAMLDSLRSTDWSPREVRR